MKYVKLALLISVLISIGLFLYSTDFSEVFETLKTVGWQALWILLSTFTAYVLGTLGWKFCLGASINKVTLSQLFTYRHIGETLALFNPTSIIAGDWLKAEALKKHGVPSTEAVNSVLLSRILMVVSQMILLIMALLWLIFSSDIVLFPNFKIWMGGLLVFLLTLLLVITYLIFKTSKERETTNNKKINNIITKGKAYKDTLNTYLRLNPKYSILAFLFFALHWLAGSLEMYFILKILNYDVKIIHGLLMDMGVILIKSVGAFIPGQIGLEEIGNKLVIMMVGISSGSLWITVSILRRSRQLFWSAIGGILYFVHRKNLI